MRLNEAAIMARELMEYHGLHDWTLVWDSAKRRFGQARFGSNEISLSIPLVVKNTRDKVEETVLHEIAHALAGPNHHHDDHWKAVAQSIGSTGERTFGNEVVTSKPKWRGTCTMGHYIGTRHRRRKNVVCAKCHSPIVWEPND